MSNGKRLQTINFILLIVLGFLILESLFHRQTRLDTTNDVIDYVDATASTPRESKSATVGKLMMQYGPVNPMYERALATHVPHNQQHSYSMSVLRQTTAGPLWSKPAYMLQHVLTELEKPAEFRLNWLFWFDSDIVLLNPNVPLEVFLPPPTPDNRWDHIQALVCQDSNGLNTGVLALKVDIWAVKFLASTLSTRESQPNVELKYNDQSAMEFWLQSNLFRNNTMHVPQRWFNAYPGKRGTASGLPDPYLPQTRWHAYAVREGDLAVHFAGNGETRAPRMLPWLDVAEKRLTKWEVPLNETGLVDEVKKFWEKDAVWEWERVQVLRERSNYNYTTPPRE
ncbi:uncharacterized protein AB675_9005 [Cyphellophora attinorum]|uniref:Alpha-1,2-galactosyltransferase n=1 Tax=Cyphellophora attinorum TaxID=1664694 RepID=A0A0N1P080_9EURO|nr:uncharacterized protein AB675_9005 [Phialophora attinorum]KPI41583.1 hypothetical protein AB675_9005 [Phialophora attinorum]